MGRRGQSKYGSLEEAAEANRQRALNYYHQNKEHANQKKHEYYMKNRERILFEQKQKRAKATEGPPLVVLEIIEDEPSIVIEIVDN